MFSSKQKTEKGEYLFAFFYFPLIQKISTLFSFLLIIYCCSFSASLTASTPSTLPLLAVNKDTSKVQKGNLIAVPLVFFTPETRWGFGAASIYAFRFNGQSADSRPSQLQVGFAYTLENQLLSYAPYQFFFKDYNFYGELGYYRYFYNFYGVGNDQPTDFEETYAVNYPRVRLNFLKKITPNTYFGFRYWFDDFNIVEVEADGQLAEGKITGSDGGVVSGAGVVLNYDTRDNIFSPSKGYLIEAISFFNSPSLGSDFSFQRYAVDAAKYFPLPWKHTLAVNAFGDFVVGDPPFNQMAVLGGTKKARGYYEGRFRDNNLLLIQAEYRFPIIWRFGAVVFGSYGGVADKISNFQLANFRYTYGGGIRFMLDPKEKINIRFDAGFAKNASGFYVTIGEAF